MVHFSTALSLVALFLSASVARPLPEDSALGNEVGVSAPNGVVMSDTEELNRNRMVPTPTWTPSPTETWYPPAPPSNDGGKDYGGGKDYDGGKDYKPPSLPTNDGYNPPAPLPTGDDKGQKYPPSNDGKDQKYPPSYTPTDKASPQPSPTYGSGSNNWGSNPFDDCVKQCQAKFPPLTPPKDTPPKDSPTKTGKTHVVWVAPTQGVLRYVPFAVNASVGDTVKFIWGANNHTVTKSSQLTPCNKTSDSPFASGVQLKDFVFEQVVNDTNPVFFHCAVPNHCTKGMFGIINPPNALAGPSSVGSMMQPMVAANPDLGKMRTYADNATKNSDAASKWGTNFDLASIPEWARESFMENVLYTRTYLAANADAFKDGEVNTDLGGNPPVIPQEITKVALGNTPGYGYGSDPSSTTTVTTPTSTPTGSNPSANLSSNDAASTARSGMAVVLAALAAGFFLL